MQFESHLLDPFCGSKWIRNGRGNTKFDFDYKAL